MGEAAERQEFCMLRYCGFSLTSKGHGMPAVQAYLGHKNIQHGGRYRTVSHLQIFLALSSGPVVAVKPTPNLFDERTSIRLHSSSWISFQ